MIVLNVTYKCKPEMRDKFLGMIKTAGIDTAVRSETGNIKYDYYIPDNNSNELLLLEKWTDAEALAEHGRQPYMGKLGELKAEYVNETIIEKYELQV